LTGHQGDVYAVRFSPDGSSLMSASHDKSILHWKMVEGGQWKNVMMLKGTYPLNSTSFLNQFNFSLFFNQLNFLFFNQFNFLFFIEFCSLINSTSSSSLNSVL
jgi:WD40 repeat protein